MVAGGKRRFGRSFSDGRGVSAATGIETGWMVAPWRGARSARARRKSCEPNASRAPPGRGQMMIRNPVAALVPSLATGYSLPSLQDCLMRRSALTSDLSKTAKSAGWNEQV